MSHMSYIMSHMSYILIRNLLDTIMYTRCGMHIPPRIQMESDNPRGCGVAHIIHHVVHVVHVIHRDIRQWSSRNHRCITISNILTSEELVVGFIEGAVHDEVTVVRKTEFECRYRDRCHTGEVEYRRAF